MMKPEPIPCEGICCGMGIWNRLKNWKNGSFSSNGSDWATFATVLVTLMLTTAGPAWAASSLKSGKALACALEGCIAADCSVFTGIAALAATPLAVHPAMSMENSAVITALLVVFCVMVRLLG